MDQKQRDKIAWVLAVVLGLVLIYRGCAVKC